MSKTKDFTKISTLAPENLDKEATKKDTKTLIIQIAELQKILYAQHKHSLLIILQGLDAAGKDSTIQKVFSAVNPLGCTVKAFKAPTEEEKDYDFLWRVHKAVPAKGMIQIFNRSHYEDVLVPVVEKWINQTQIERRFAQINNFEKLLTEENNTTILKFYLHISPEKQKEKLLERKTDPEKFWKHDDKDWEVASQRKAYMKAYEAIFENCHEIPWHIIPADQAWYRKYLVAKIILKSLQQLSLNYPKKNSVEKNKS